MSELTTAAQRTRRAIISAGIDMLRRNPRAPLAEVAEAAGVSRSTFHRYFADRDALKAAISEVAAERYLQAVTNARLAEGTGLEAFRRLCIELIDSLDVLVWWMTDLGGDDVDTEVTDEDQQIAAAVLRGHEDGTMDRELSPDWLGSVIWSVLYAVRFVPTPAGLSDFDARQQALRTLMKIAAA